MPQRKRRDWDFRITALLLGLVFAVFWTAAAYGISHWRGAPYSPKALAIFGMATAIFGLWLACLAKMGKD